MKTKASGRAAGAAFDATLRAVVKFAGLPLATEIQADAAGRLALQIIDVRVTKLFGIMASPDMTLTREHGPTVALSVPSLQAAVRAQLSDVITVRELPEHVANLAPHATGRRMVGALTIAPSVTSFQAGGRHLLNLSGPFHDVFLFVVCYLLALSPTDKVRPCPNCSTLFYRVGRQTHCSKPCYAKSYWKDGYPAEKKRRARGRWYESQGWTLGARSKKKRSTRRGARA